MHDTGKNIDWLRKRVATAIVTLLLAGLLLSSVATASSDFAPGRLIVRFSHPPTALGDFSSQYSGLQNVQPLLPERRSTALGARFTAPVYVFQFADDSTLAAAQRTLESDPQVVYAERDPIVQLFSDSLYHYQWSLHNEGQDYLGIERIPGPRNDTMLIKRGLPGADIGWPVADALAPPHHRTIVAIIDTGVDSHHIDLAANIWHNSQEIPDNGIDDDHNGYVDDFIGWDFSGDSTLMTGIEADPDPSDEVGHGSHVAGIVAAVADNDVGIRGIAPHAEIMCLKIFPNAFTSISAQAVIYAVENGARVINASWGGFYYSSILEDAIKFARDQGVLFVAASGNTGDDTRFYPASLSEPLTVGASNSEDEVTSFSSFGPWVDMVAPGRDILSVKATGVDLYASSGEPGVRIVDSRWILADGTSMAAPHVTGAAALLLSLSPGLSIDSLRTLLTATADDFKDPYKRSDNFPGLDEYSGYGRLNVGRAYGMTNGNYVELESPPFGNICSGSIPLVGSAVAGGGENFEMLVRPQGQQDWITLATGTADRVRDTLAIWQSDAYDGTAEFALRLGDHLEYRSKAFLANSEQAEIISPAAGDTVISSAQIIGSASGPGFEKFELYYTSDDPPSGPVLITSSSKISYEETLTDWKVGPIPPGSGRLRLRVFTEGQTLETETPIHVTSLLSEGFPVRPLARPSLALTAGNIDDDPEPELVSGADSSIIIVDPVGNRVEELQPDFGTSFTGTVSLYDFDGDGRDEMVAVSDSGVAIMYGDGSFAPGWPKFLITGYMFNSLPTPLVTDIDGDGAMEVLIINRSGVIYCWRFDGSSYFRTNGGVFARLVDRPTFGLFGGSSTPFLFAFDFNKDGYEDVGTLYPASSASGGLFMFSGRTGQPLYPHEGKRVRAIEDIFGGAVADFDGDGIPEIAFCHWFSGSDFLMGVSVVEADGSLLPGWPKLYYDRPQWLSAYPAVADLNGDSLPELICTFSAIDGGEVAVWHGDGTPWLQNDLGTNDGHLASTENSLGPPIVADLDGDGQYEIACRGGSLFWGKYERIHAWNLDGTVVTDWPAYTFADPNLVTYSPFIPTVGDFDGDGLLELVSASSDRGIYSWDLPTRATPEAIAWGTYLFNSRHTGVLQSFAEPTYVSDTPTSPNSFQLAQNYPNPFNGETSVEIYLPADAEVRVEVFNILGQKVATLADEFLTAGVHHFDWKGRSDSGSELASGVYFFRLSDGKTSTTRKSLYLK